MHFTYNGELVHSVDVDVGVDGAGLGAGSSVNTISSTRPAVGASLGTSATVGAKTETCTYPITSVILYGTAQFVDAWRGGYEGFELLDLECAARLVLQRQAYLIYRWSLTRLLLLDESLVCGVARCFDVSPDNFVPQEEEVQFYLKEPCFLWRFSRHNYDTVVSSIREGRLLMLSDKGHDSSPPVGYEYDIEKHLLIGALEEKFKCQLNQWEVLEYRHSLDFHLHSMDKETTYQEFVSVLLTGGCGRYTSELYRQLKRKEATSRVSHKGQRGILQKIYMRIAPGRTKSKIYNVPESTTMGKQASGGVYPFLQRGAASISEELVTSLPEFVLERGKIHLWDSDWINEALLDHEHPFSLYRFAVAIDDGYLATKYKHINARGETVRTGWGNGKPVAIGRKRLLEMWMQCVPTKYTHQRYCHRLETSKWHQIEESCMRQIELFKDSKVNLVTDITAANLDSCVHLDSDDKEAYIIRNAEISGCLYRPTEGHHNLPTPLLLGDKSLPSSDYKRKVGVMSAPNPCLQIEREQFLENGLTYNLQMFNTDVINPSKDVYIPPRVCNLEKLALNAISNQNAFIGERYHVDLGPYVEKIDFSCLFLRDGKTKPFRRSHNLYIDKVSARFERLYPRLVEVLQVADNLKSFLYSSQDMAQHVVEDSIKLSCFVSTQVISFPHVHYVNSSQTKINIANYLTFYFTKHNRDALGRDAQTYFDSRLKIQFKSSKHSRFLFSFARDRYLSELYTAVQVLQTEAGQREHLRWPVHEFEFDSEYMDLIKLFFPHRHNDIATIIECASKERHPRQVHSACTPPTVLKEVL